MEMLYDRQKEHFMLDVLDLKLDEAGYIQFEDTGEYVETLCGEECARIDKVGAFAHDEEEDVKVVHDRFSCMVEWQSDRDLDR